MYLVAGKSKTNHLMDTLFDEEAVENKGKKRIYKQGIDCHLAMFPSKYLKKNVFDFGSI